MIQQNIFKITFYDTERGEIYIYKFLAKTMREAMDIAEEFKREKEFSDIVNIQNESVIYVRATK